MRRLLIFGILLFAQTMVAQNFTLSRFVCVPESCDQTGPLATISVAQVNASIECSRNGVPIGDGNVLAEALVGFVGSCHAPYEPHAQIRALSTEILDDCDNIFEIDFVRPEAEIFDAFGTLKWHKFTEIQCDGGGGLPVVTGTQPC